MDQSESNCCQIASKTCYDQQDFNQYGQVFDCAFHPTRPILACGLSGGSVQIFCAIDSSTPFTNWTCGDQLQVQVEAHVNCLAWNVDGTRLAAGCFDGTVAMWRCDDSEDDGLVFKSKEHHLAVFAIIWNRWNRNLLATRSRDEGEIQRILTWISDTESPVACQEFPIDSKFVWDFEWISSNRLAVCTREGFILICDTGQKFPVKRLLHSGVCRVRWHFSLHYLISCSTDGSVKVWSKKRYKDVGQTQFDSRIQCVDVHGIRSGGSAIIASGLENGSVVIWHVTENRCQTLDAHLDAVLRVSFSPDGLYLATIDSEEKLIIWSTKNWAKTFEHVKQMNVDWNHIRWNPISTKLAISSSTSQVQVVEFRDDSEPE